MSILAILESIKNTSSTLGKKAILEQNKDNVTLQKVLKYTLDPSIVSGYKKLPDADNVYQHMTLDEAIDKLECIYKRALTGHTGRDFIASVLGSVSPDDAEVLRKMLTKNLDCGIQEKNCNDVFGKGFIKDEPYMRCSLLDKKTVKNINFKGHGYAVSEVKMDGQYLNHVVINGALTSSSRNGKLYDFLGCRDGEMAGLAHQIQMNDERFSSGVVFMGEGLVLDNDGETILPRTTGNGIIQKAGKDSISQNEAMRTVFVLWDVVPYDAFCEGTWNVKRKERRELLESAINVLGSDFVRMVKYRKVQNIKEAFEYNNELMVQGEEGSVLKCEDGIWKSHTSPKQLKVKLKMQLDLRIVGFNEGEGKRKGSLGSLQLESACGTLKVNVGTGIKEKDAEWTFKTIWERMQELIGKVVTVECNEIVIDKRTGEPSLFLPVFIEFRFDKNTCDDYTRILEIRDSAVEVFSNSIIEALS
ncbi:hypothetical protein QPL51_05090 [Escherichia coli]|uniref:ATP-dependent DNA ligase n=1 Tax=Escherichia coli TaxID=562 RepID=UPI00287AE309|nr:hypothetical protein [Escherichia coli]MDS1552415.1 hypothetical protein [Escherichia coli]